MPSPGRLARSHYSPPGAGVARKVVKAWDAAYAHRRTRSIYREWRMPGITARFTRKGLSNDAGFHDTSGFLSVKMKIGAFLPYAERGNALKI